jgi:hypothetical protein
MLISAVTKTLFTATIRRAIASLAAACITLATTTFSEQAHAATAFLVSCNATTSVTGRFIYVGIYQYGGQHFQRAFSTYCPQSVEVY